MRHIKKKAFDKNVKTMCGIILYQDQAFDPEDIPRVVIMGF